MIKLRNPNYKIEIFFETEEEYNNYAKKIIEDDLPFIVHGHPKGRPSHAINTLSCKKLVIGFYKQMELIKEYNDKLAIKAIEKDKGIKIEDYIAILLKDIDLDKDISKYI